MTTLVDARPPGVDAYYRPGDPLTVVITWPTGSLTGRTFTSTLGAASLGVAIVGDVMTITATPAQTAAAAQVEAWELVDTTAADDVTAIVGRWAASDAATGRHDVTVTVTNAAGDLDVTLQGMSAVGDLTVAGTLSVNGQPLTLLEAGDPTEVDLDTAGDVTTLTLLGTIARRAVIHQSGQYYFNVYGTSTAQTMVQSQLCLYPVELSPGTIDRIGVHVSTLAAGGTIRLGVYADNGGVPLNLIAEANDGIGAYPLDASSTGTKEAAISATITKGGLGWLAVCAQGSAAIAIRGGAVTVGSGGVPVPLGTGTPSDDDTFRGCRIQSSVTTALPSALTLGGANSQRARIFFRYA